MTARSDLGIVVVNYGSSSLLARNLVALDQLVRPERIVVVDNFHSTYERQALTALASSRGWSLVANESNLGFGAAMNLGVDRAEKLGAVYLLLLNPDVEITAAVVEELAGECSRRPESIVSPRILRHDGSDWFRGGTVLLGAGRTSTARDADSSAPGGWLSGACLVLHIDLWRQLGGFDDDYFLYWEDVDLSWRCAAAGGGLLVRDDLSAVHSVGGTQPGAGKSPQYVYYNCRNRLLFAAKHLTRRQLRRWLVASPGYAWQVLGRGGRRALARRPFSLFGAALRGTISGYWCALRASA